MCPAADGTASSTSSSGGIWQHWASKYQYWASRLAKPRQELPQQLTDWQQESKLYFFSNSSQCLARPVFGHFLWEEESLPSGTETVSKAETKSKTALRVDAKKSEAPASARDRTRQLLMRFWPAPGDWLALRTAWGQDHASPICLVDSMASGAKPSLAGVPQQLDGPQLSWEDPKWWSSSRGTRPADAVGNGSIGSAGGSAPWHVSSRGRERRWRARTGAFWRKLGTLRGQQAFEVALAEPSSDEGDLEHVDGIGAARHGSWDRAQMWQVGFTGWLPRMNG